MSRLLTEDMVWHYIKMSVPIKYREDLLKALRHVPSFEDGQVKKALEKQIPMKPTTKTDSDKYVYEEYLCPSCKMDLCPSFGLVKHCDECGQAIDWSDIE